MEKQAMDPIGGGELITCPSGLSGTIRGLKVREERILADRKLAKAGQQMDALLAACWLDTHDEGPYALDGKPPQWDGVLQGDRFYALLRIRALTYGEEYAFSVACTHAACRRRIDWSVNLIDLAIRPLAASSRQALINGNRLEATLPGCGKRLWFQLATGSHERRLAQVRDSHADRLLSALLSLRVIEVEGIAAQNRRAFFEDLSMRDANDLLAQFEQADCGVDTAIDIECPHCLHGQGVDLPLDPGFLWPSHKHPSSSSRPAA